MNLQENLNHEKSNAIMEKSKSLFPGGVNSPVRSFRSVGGNPIVFSHGKGKELFCVDGHRYIDFCASWGPLIVGYTNSNVLCAIQDQLNKAVTFGAPSELEMKLAEKVINWIPGLEMLRFVSSGTEATMSAIRVARAATNKSKFIKFEGCYHGHADPFLVKAGSGLATLGNPSSAGVPVGTTNDTLTAIYNNEESVLELFKVYGNDIAAVIIEPVAANMGLVLPKKGFLNFLRKVTKNHNALLIFDEVMTGFRVAKGGCAEIFDVQPDLWTFGKIIGGGLPAAAYGGKKEFMQMVAPLGPAYQAGTLSGNPLAMAAGYATLSEIERQNAYEVLEELGTYLDKLVEKELRPYIEQGKLFYVRFASFFCFFFGTKKAPENYEEVTKTNMAMFNKVYHAWIENGIYLGPSGFEVGFLSTCLEKNDILKMLKILQRVLSTEE